jgi:hypothetical protein
MVELILVKLVLAVFFLSLVVLCIFVVIFVFVILGHLILWVVQLSHIIPNELQYFCDLYEVFVGLSDNNGLTFGKDLTKELFDDETAKVAIVIAQVEVF